MKKGLIKKILFVIVFCLSLTFVKVNAEGNKTEVPGAYYEVNENQETRTLDGGIQYIRDTSTSHADKIEADSYGCGEINTVPQQVNILKVKTSQTLKVVNWRSSEKTFWKKATVVDLAKDFERNNPGWIVIAAVNGDFFDIKGEGKLPYQTNNATYSNGEMYRAQNGRAVGFKNDGSTNSLVYGKFETTDLQLQIFDENNNIIGTYDITNKNEVPEENGVSVYFPYPIEQGNLAEITIPANNSYIVERGYMLASDENYLYAKGAISQINTEVKCEAYEFGVVTTNEEIRSKLSLGTTIRVQRNIIGDYAECDNVTGVGEILLQNGEPTVSSDWYRHPRTTVGITAEGEIVLMTVDGRQTDKNMYGMSYQELQATMKYYGCVDAYNMDGGGSTTMIIRNADGEFDVMNSPSDQGGARADSNAVLIVAPRLNAQLNSVLDNSLTISYDKSNDVEVSNVMLNIDGKKVPVSGNKFTYDQLSPNKEYEYYLTYDITHKGSTSSHQTPTRTIKTGKQRPKLLNYYFTETETDVIFNYEVNDPEGTLTFINLTIGRKMYILSAGSTSYAVSKSEINSSEYKIILEFNVDSSTKEYGKDTYVIEKEPKKKGCKKKSVALFATVNSLALVLYLFKKKH